MALQGVQMPSIAGVYGVKDFREDLRPDGGLGKLAQMAMNLYQFKSNQAQQKEMQDAAQQFQAAQADKNATNQAIAADVQRRWQAKEKELDREAQRNLTEAKWAQDNALMEKQQELQNRKELASFQADATPVINMTIDETNPVAIRDKGNRLETIIAKAKNIGDNDTLATATQEYNRLMGMYGKDTGGARAGGVLQQAEEMGKLNSDMKDLIANASPEAAEKYLIANKDKFSEIELQKYSDMIDEQRKRRGRQARSDARDYEASQKPRLKIKKK